MTCAWQMPGDEAMTESVDGPNLSVDRVVTQDDTASQSVVSLDRCVDGVFHCCFDLCRHLLDPGKDRGDVFFEALLVVGRHDGTPFLMLDINHR